MTTTETGPITVAEIKPEAWPDLTAADAKVYENAQIPFPNLAGNDDVARRTLVWVNAARKQWEMETRDIQQEWRWTDYLFRANTISKGLNRDVHVPEILKAHRALLPRAEEAFFGAGADWYRVIGRGDSSQYREVAEAALLHWGLEQAKYRRLVRPAISSQLKYQIACLKVNWEVEKRLVPYHWIERKVDPKTGEVTEVHKRQLKTVARFVGNRIRLVDPYRLITDPCRYLPEDMDYIGDFSSVPVVSLDNIPGLDKAAVARFKDDKAKGEKEQTDVRIRPSTVARSGLRQAAASNEPSMTVQHGNDRCELLELWGWADLLDEGMVRQWKVIVADCSHVLEVRLNPHDDQHLPYALETSSDNGFELFDVSLYSPAFRPQDELDHFRATLYESADLQMAPRVFIRGEAADVPDTLYDSPAGSIFKGIQGDVYFMPTPNMWSGVPFMDQVLRREFEEIIGVPRSWEGADTSAPGGGAATATEFRGKQQEGNRRLLGIIRTVSNLWEQVLRIMHANNRQFLTDKTKFRVLSKRRAADLGATEITMMPSDLLEAVDFEFPGLSRIGSYGLRGQDLLNFFTVLQPVIMEHPEEYDVVALSRKVYEEMVGEEVDDDVIRPKTPIGDLESQMSENARLRLGMPVKIDPQDNDQEHLQQMEAQGMFELVRKPGTPFPVKDVTMRHAGAHMRALQDKIAQEEARQRQAEQRQLQMSGPEQQETPPSGGMEREPSQTNGPGTAQQNPKVGRPTPPMTQSQNERP